MGNYCQQKIMLKSKDKLTYFVAKIISDNDDLKLIIDELDDKLDIYFANSSDTFKIENGKFFNNSDHDNFAFAIVSGDKIIATYKKGKAEINAEKINKSTLSGYDDEKISEINYYDNRLIGELFEKQSACDNNVTIESEHQEATEKNSVFEQTALDASSPYTCEKTSSGNYYVEKRNSIERLFCHGKRLANLENIVNDSKFCSLNFSKDKSYVFGVIYDNNDPKYLLYGLKGNFSSPPQNLSFFNCFIPESLFSFYGDGYYFLCQDAKNGESIKQKMDKFKSL